MTTEQVRAAVAALSPADDFVWDGKDEDDRPATAEELKNAVAAARRQRGRPAGSGTREQISVRYSHDVVASFRATGTGWQTRMDAALRDWLKTHDPSEIKLG